jgi:hypothetical protein
LLATLFSSALDWRTLGHELDMAFTFDEIRADNDAWLLGIFFSAFDFADGRL